MFVIFIILILIIGYLSEFGKRKVFKEIAKKRNGRVKGIISPKLIFLYNDCKFEVTGRKYKPGHTTAVTHETVHGGTYTTATHSKPTPPLTRIRVKLQHKTHHKMIMRKKSFYSKIGKIFGLKYIEIGNKEIDEYYAIRGDVQEFIRFIFNRTVMKKMSKIHYPKLIKLKKRKLIIVKQGYHESELFFELQIEMAIAIVDRIIEFNYL